MLFIKWIASSGKLFTLTDCLKKIITPYLEILLVLFCLLACVPGMCGENHTEVCGHCLQNSTCDHVDGTCENGCEAGYQGRDCKSGRQI